MENIAIDLAKNSKLPWFQVDSSSVNIIQTPKDFHDSIIDGITTAKERIVLASLYLGSDETEIIELLNMQLKKNHKLKVWILADYFRGTRKDKNGNSTYSLVEELKLNYSERVHIGLYHCPEVGNCVKNLVPSRLIEGFGLQHMKCYLFDKETILSGANLSRDYFTNRQDRYVKISSYKLANYFADFIATVIRHSFSVEKDGLIPPVKFSLGSKTNRENFKNEFRTALQKFQGNWTKDVKLPLLDESNVIIFPTIQIDYLGIVDDQETTLKIIKILPQLKNASIYYLFGYFNIPKVFLNQILKFPASSIYITSSQEANGFYQSKGISKYLPPAYTYLSALFLKDIKRRNLSELINLYEYKRKGWTWHAKGLFAFDKNGFLTMIGSSNMNQRSIQRDLEAQILLLSNNKILKQKFQHNVNDLLKYTTPVNYKNLMLKKHPMLLRLATRLIRNML